MEMPQRESAYPSDRTFWIEIQIPAGFGWVVLQIVTIFPQHSGSSMDNGYIFAIE